MLNLIVPMAGRGSRFNKAGQLKPKPLIDLHGKPFFWWAVESVKANNDLASLTFVVLQEHVDNYLIDQELLGAYPESKLVVINDVTKGASETAWLAIKSSPELVGPIAFLDCDHAFELGNVDDVLLKMKADTAAALCYFKSNSPAYSYLLLNEQKDIIGTVEKKVVSERAIAGFYLFANAEIFESAYVEYLSNCPYDELFMSGIYDLLIKSGKSVASVGLNKHLSFGTPEELAIIDGLHEEAFPSWYLSSEGSQI